MADYPDIDLKSSVQTTKEGNVSDSNPADVLIKTAKKPTASISETRAAITHKIATAINESEYAKRVAKTLRLKNERLAHEESALAEQPKQLTSKRKVKKVKTN